MNNDMISYPGRCETPRWQMSRNIVANMPRGWRIFCRLKYASVASDKRCSYERIKAHKGSQIGPIVVVVLVKTFIVVVMMMMRMYIMMVVKMVMMLPKITILITRIFEGGAGRVIASSGIFDANCVLLPRPWICEIFSFFVIVNVTIIIIVSSTPCHHVHWGHYLHCLSGAKCVNTLLLI